MDRLKEIFTLLCEKSSLANIFTNLFNSEEIHPKKIVVMDKIKDFENEFAINNKYKWSQSENNV